MKMAPSFLLTGLLITVLSACPSGPGAADGLDSNSPKPTANEEIAVKCDPIVEEYRDLMADYEAGLKDMIAAREVDAKRQERWSAKAKALSEKIQERGERELGLRCWQEFNSIAQTYAPRIAKLGMEMSMIQVGDKMDPATKEALKKALGQ